MRHTALFPILCAPLLGVAACDRAPEASSGAASSAAASPTDSPAAGALPATVAAPAPGPAPADDAPTIAAPVASATSARPTACAAEIGTAAAARRVEVCRNVSPATHPPCNAANSCAMIEDEIARSCALFDGKGAPMPGCTPAPTSGAAAAAVIRRYYSALNAHDYATAWDQWGDGGQPGQTFATFQSGFARTRATEVRVGTLPPPEGGAGSIYQEVPVTVSATLADGTRQRFAGSYVVRRVNGVDGASPAQLRWHIDSARLKPA